MVGTTSIRRLAAGTAAIGAALALGACGGSSGGGGTQSATFHKTCADVDLSKPPTQPVQITIGRGKAAEEPLWLMQVNKDLTRYQSKWYTIRFQPFDSTETRYVAFQAGKIDAMTTPVQPEIVATARGSVNLVNVVTIMQDAGPSDFSTTFVAKKGSGITGIKDLKGKKIAIVGLGTELDWLAKAAVDKAGYDPQADAQYVTIPFPSQAQALANGQVDVAGLPEPFHTLAQQQGQIQDVFNARDVTGYAYDLLNVAFQRSFVQKNLGAVCAFRDDFKKEMAFWRTHKTEARKMLIGTEFVQLPPKVYLATKDYYRPPDGEVHPDATRKVMESSLKLEIFPSNTRIDVNRLYAKGISSGL